MADKGDQEATLALLERLELTSGGRLLWRILLSRCAILEKPSFLERCIENGFGSHHFDTMLQCLSYSKEETFSGEFLDGLISRLGNAGLAFDGLKQTLDYLYSNELKASPHVLLAYLECAQQAIEIGREFDTFPKTVEYFLSDSGIHQAVPKARND